MGCYARLDEGTHRIGGAILRHSSPPGVPLVGFSFIPAIGWDRNRKGAMTTAQQSRTALIDVSLRAPSLPQDGGLTPRQRDILGHIARGRSNKQIAFALGIRERTVKFHVAALFERLGTQSRTEALVVALRAGVISLDETA
jgi:DNA-binding CsgD family transcriptional regulator